MTRINRALRIACFAMLLMVCSSAPGEAGWGHLRGRFVYAGSPPTARDIRITKNHKVFGDAIPDNSLLVNAKNRGIANVVIFLRDEKAPKLAIHHSYQKSANSKVAMTMRGGKFTPRVLLLRTTQTLRQVNDDKDQVTYVPMFDCFRRSGLETYILPPSQQVVERRGFHKQPLPCYVSCAIHPWIKSYVLIRDNPYMAKTDANGCFAIENIPVGTHTFCFWHEKVNLLREVSIGDQATNSKGRLTITINEGENTLKPAMLRPNLFAADDGRTKGF